MTLHPAIKKWVVPVGAALASGLSTLSLNLGVWGWLFGAAVALALWLRPERTTTGFPPPQLELEARLALGGKTQLALVAVEGVRYLVLHSDRGLHLERCDDGVHTCSERVAPRSPFPTPSSMSRDGWIQ